MEEKLYARAMIEIEANSVFKESVVVAIPNIEGEDYTCAKVNVEYEWKPPLCSTCKTFDHSTETCPLAVKDVPNKVVDTLDEGFQVVKGRSKGKKQNERKVVFKPKTTILYKQV